MAAFIPGESPPEVKSPIFLICVIERALFPRLKKIVFLNKPYAKVTGIN